MVKVRAGVLAFAACVLSVLLAGCGGGGGSGGGSADHTYILTPSSQLASGLYITVISPVAFPQSILDKARKNATFVKHAAGPEACSYSKTIQGVSGQYADLNGKTVTVKINGTSGFTSQVCSILKKVTFNPTNIVGTG